MNILKLFGQHGLKSFSNLTREEFEKHLEKRRYGDFKLSQGITPAPHITPVAGFTKRFLDEGSAIVVSVSLEILFDFFLDLIDIFQEQVDVFVETSYPSNFDFPLNRTNKKFVRSHIDISILKSIIFDFEDQLVNDGNLCFSITNNEFEIQLSEHKFFVIFGWEECKSALGEVLLNYNIPLLPKMQLVTDFEHIHSTTEEFAEKSEQLIATLGAEEE